MSLVVELQTSDSTPEELRTKGWLKLDIFTSTLTLRSGAWRVPFHDLPIKPDIASTDLTARSQQDAALYLRIVHQRDSRSQLEAVISASNHVDYQNPSGPSRVPVGRLSADQETPYSWGL